MLTLTFDQELELIVQRERVKVNFIKSWKKYFPVILEYGHTTTSANKLLDSVDLSQKGKLAVFI